MMRAHYAILYSLLNIVFTSLCHHRAHGFTVTQPHVAVAKKRPYTGTTQVAASSDEDDDENKKLLEKARKLREEALQLEQKLREQPQKVKEPAPSTKPTPKVSELPDSVWTFSYRFSSQPKDDTKNEDSVVLPNYSGKVTIRLLPDGYSEMVSQSDDAKISIKKVWGWDEEYSREDEQQYLLFSMDVTFPKTDPKLPGQSKRYYFQARIDRKSNEIELKDGTITCKKDIAEKTKGRWGLFQVAGILSQFRYVGDFVAKPSSLES